jgi:hypothetical protein
MRIRKETECYYTDNPTRVDLPVYVPTPAPAPSALPSVTELELEAMRVVDAVELAADPINRYNVARAGIKLAAWVARKLR